MKKFNFTHILAIIAVMFFASCSTEQAVFTAPDNSVERIDMVIEGNDQENIFLQDASSSNSLVDFNFYGAGANQFDIRLHIDAQRTLVIKLVDQNSSDLWENETGYSMFATQDLDDKQKYVTIELIDATQRTTYRSNIGDDFPRGTYVNVFNIIDFNPANNEVFARIIDMPMMSTTSQEVVNINGTFRGSFSSIN